MTLGGYVCMLGATGTITLLFGWCCWKIAFAKKRNADETPESREEC